MEAREKTELTKIGIITFLGLIAFVISLFWLKGHKVHHYQQFTFYFKNVNGLEEGAPLTWNGLKVGVVESVIPVLENTEVDTFPSEKLIEIGKQHLTSAEKALRRGRLEDLGFARDAINRGQLEIALGQANKEQSEVRKGQHVQVKAVITSKDIPISALNQVGIVPSGLIGEQYLDISSIYINDMDQAARLAEDLKDFAPQFVIREPVKLDRLIRANVESAESLRDLTHRANALFRDQDAENISEILDSISEITSDKEFRQDFKESVENFKDFKIWKLIF